MVKNLKETINKIDEEIIVKSKEYYKEALKHQKEISNLQKTIIGVFDGETRKIL